MDTRGTSREGAATGTEAGSAHYVWRIPGVAVQIRIRIEVVRRIRKYLAAQSERSPNSEAGGLLLGKPHPPGVEIDDFVPVVREEKSGPHFAFTKEGKEDLRNRIQAANGLQSGLAVVGYFRSDVREGIRLYEDDLALIRELFGDHSNVFLVVRPGEVPHPTAGFFFWEGDRIFSSFSFMEFSFHESVLTSDAYASADDDGNRPKQPDAVAPVVGTNNGFKPAPVEPVRILATTDPVRSRRWPVVAGIVVLLGLGGYFLVTKLVNSSRLGGQPGLTRTGAQAASMGLSVSRSGTDITIAWNGQAKLVADARVGMLTIEDGNTRHDLPLTLGQLRSSRLVYTPIHDTVQIALEVFAHDGKVSRESVIALSNAGAPATTAANARPFQVEVPVDKSSPQPLPSSEIPARLRNPARDFVPPVGRAPSGTPVASTPAEPPSALAPRVDIPRMDLPVGRPDAAPAPVQVPQGALSPNSEQTSQARPAVSQPAHQPPVPLRQVRPVLPPNVKAMLTGRVNVRVRVRVDANGKVESAEPLDTTGSVGRFLGSAAASAARTWTFQPATTGGRKVPGELTVEFIFMPER